MSTDTQQPAAIPTVSQVEAEMKPSADAPAPAPAPAYDPPQVGYWIDTFGNVYSSNGAASLFCSRPLPFPHGSCSLAAVALRTLPAASPHHDRCS
eukprot:SAG22_NODE_1049_length_5844_cov_2.122520_8_plen_95_part_00